MKRIVLAAALLALATCGQASAALLTSSLGVQDFTDGDMLLAGTFIGAQSGEAAPVGFHGGDLPFGTDTFDETWTLTYTVGTVTSASFKIGIWEHDSAHAGDQVASFTVDGVDFTAELNAVFNAAGGSSVLPPDPPPRPSEYNVYTIGLAGAGLLTALSDGSATFALELKDGVSPASPGGTINNGAGLDFSSLTVDIDDTGAVVPEPSSIAIYSMLGLVAAGWHVRRKRKAKAA